MAKAKSPNATTPRQFRLGQETLDHLDRISAHYDLRSRADAIRIAARQMADGLPAPPPQQKKSRKPKKST